MVKKSAVTIPEGFAPVGKNVAVKVEGNLLLVAIDLTADQGKSASGKTNVIATTSGNMAVPGASNGAIIGINCYRK